MYDLRSETDNQKLVDEIAKDWTTSSISSVQMAMCEFAKKLTENPSKVTGYNLTAKIVILSILRPGPKSVETNPFS